MGIKKDYLHEVIETIHKIDPSLEKEDIKRIATSIIKKRMKDPSIVLDNNVTGDHQTVTFTELCNWLDSTKPVVSGNATFFMQPEERESPTSNMLRSLKAERKAIKKEMFSKVPGSDEYQQLDLFQLLIKIIMNAEYGASGAKMSAFYTKYSPPATTLMAQAIITIMAAFFEGFIGDNQKFFNINELFDWMNKVIKKKKNIDKWVYRPTPKEVIDRILPHLVTMSPEDYSVISAYVNHCNEKELVYLYYANNIKAFVSHNKIAQKLIQKILQTLPNLEATTSIPLKFKEKFSEVNDYNHWVSEEMFLDPYKIPEKIKEEVDEFSDLLYQYVYVEYITPDSIVKLNNHTRNTVLLVDTDSNIINADLFVSFILDEIFPNNTFGRDRMYNDMILISLLAACLDKCIKALLDYYGRTHNMNKEARAEIAMKNEFLFRRFFIMLTKKRYCASIVLREGNIFIPFKDEIKGVDFIKAGVSDDVSKRFTSFVKDYIIFPDKLDLKGLLNAINKFQKEIYDDLKNGGVTYLKPQQYKDEGAYKKIKDKNGVESSQAWRTQVFRGANVWNTLYPDNKIYSLDRVRVIKLTINDEKDIEPLKETHSEIYKKIKEKIFNSSNPQVQKAGLKVISIPVSVKEIPDWLRNYIDYDIIISDVISSFKSVLEALKIEPLKFKTKGGNKASIPSHLISL